MNWRKFLIAEMKFFYPNYYTVLGVVFGIALNLTFYYFMSKTFIPNLNLSNLFLSKGYFEYLVIGELLLVLPSFLLIEVQDHFFRYKELGILEQFHFFKGGILGNFFKSIIVNYTLKTIIIGVNLIGALVLFSSNLGFLFVLKFLGTLILGVLVFSPMVFLNFMICLIMNRKSGILNHLFSLLTILSGAYFPLEVFTNENIKLFFSKSPIALYVFISRSILYGVKINGGDVLLLISWSFSLYFLYKVLYFFYYQSKISNVT